MSERSENLPSEDKQKEWTLMFYFASDNPLAPNVVTQLKALKSAGFHQDVNVVLQFDPNPQDIQTHVFDVNMMNKIANTYEREIKKSETPPFTFWQGNDPYIRNLVLDKLWNENKDEMPIKEIVLNHIKEEYQGLAVKLAVPNPEPAKPTGEGDGTKAAGTEGAGKVNESEPGPKKSLAAFLDFCIKEYPARHYMLFLLGHGLVVGNDMFLYDQNAVSDSLTLRDLGEVLDTFTDEKLELVGFHSCGLSALEVACELQGKTKFMIASQGTEFVGSWPYREILIRVFNDVIRKNTGEEDIKKTIVKIFAYILKSSYDFQMAGYSFDLCLCNLRGIGSIAKPLATLSEKLRGGMALTKKKEDGSEVNDPLIQERILLAHWEAQSFWNESYTDLYDFCRCLKRRCEEVVSQTDANLTLLGEIAFDCEELIKVLEREMRVPPEILDRQPPILLAEFAGPEYQYSNGLSVYFPWSKPANERFWSEEYPNYRFNRADAFASGWREFLQDYFVATRRPTIGDTVSSATKPSVTQKLLEAITSHFKKEGLLGGSADDSALKPIGSAGLGVNPKPIGSAGLGTPPPPAEPKPIGSAGLAKPFGSAGTGECGCASIKNYPSSTFPTSPDYFTVINRAKESD